MCIYLYKVFHFQINEFVKRARDAKIHAYIISHLKKEMPALMGKSKAQKRLVSNLETVFAEVSLFVSLSSCHDTMTVGIPGLFSSLLFASYLKLCFENTGSKRVSFTSGRFPQRGSLQGGSDALQHRRFREVEA